MNEIDLKLKIAELQDMIHAAHPRMPLLLKDIHLLLKSDPDNVTLLTDEDIAIIVSGLKKQTMTEITTATLKKKTPLKNTSIMDL